ncbi:MAG: MBL fold metallo-hydrolase [Phycisphaerales bacterium]|nr:MBL fold metallo-hydrolase [Phycisphaerales bacterium]
MTTHKTDSITLDRRRFLATLAASAGTLAISNPAIARLTRGMVSSPVLAWDTIHKAGIHAMVDRNAGGNSLVATFGKQTLLVDTKFAHLGGALFSDAQQFAGEQERFDLTLINTHHHGDHTGGNALIVPHANAYAHKNAVKRIKTQLDTYKQSAKSGPAQIKRNKGSAEMLKLAIQAADASESWTRADISPQNRVPDEGATITLGESNIAMHHFGRGHTDNDLVVHFPDQNVVHTGDLVFAGLHPFFDPNARPTAIGWTKSLKGILELCDDKTIVIPGHGPIGNNQTVQAQLDYMNQLIEHVQADIDAGVSKEETAKNTWGFMEGLGFESIRERAINTVYDELS